MTLTAGFDSLSHRRVFYRSPLNWQAFVTRLFCVVALLATTTSFTHTGNQSDLAIAKVGKRLSLTEIPGNLALEDRFRFILGRSLFEDAWVASGASTTLRDGLGPVFSARSCSACHSKAGRSHQPFARVFKDVSSNALVARFDNLNRQAPTHPIGTTWSAFALAHRTVTPSSHRNMGEGTLQARASPVRFLYPNGEEITLQQPEFRLTGAIVQPTEISVRIAPSLDLVQLIEQVSSTAILELADPADLNRDGISGRVHPAVRLESSALVGRFGLKARHPDLQRQVASALSEDIGITSALFPQEACGDLQAFCKLAPNGRGDSVGGLPKSDHSAVYEITNENLSAIVFFLSQLNFSRSNEARGISADSKGARLFESTGCSVCHRPVLRANGGRSVKLYSDLLLHDMGPALADGGIQASELGREWRTAPLRNIRLRKALTKAENYLHDGRAQTLEQAIVWHGGEAATSKNRFENLSRADRQTLLLYVSGL